MHVNVMINYMNSLRKIKYSTGKIKIKNKLITSIYAYQKYFNIVWSFALENSMNTEYA